VENLTDTTPLSEQTNLLLRVVYAKIEDDPELWVATQEKKECCGWKFPDELASEECKRTPQPACGAKILRHHMNFWGMFLGLSYALAIVHCVTLAVQFAIFRWTSEPPPQERRTGKINISVQSMRWGVALVAISMFAMTYDIIIIFTSWVANTMPNQLWVYGFNLAISGCTLLFTPCAMFVGKWLLKINEGDTESIEKHKPLLELFKWILRVYAVFNVLVLCLAAAQGIAYTVYAVSAIEAFSTKRSITDASNPWIVFMKNWIETYPELWRKMQDALVCCGFDEESHGAGEAPQDACAYCTSYTYMGAYCPLNEFSHVNKTIRDTADGCAFDVTWYSMAYSSATAAVSLAQTFVLGGMAIVSLGIAGVRVKQLGKESILDQVSWLSPFKTRYLIDSLLTPGLIRIPQRLLLTPIHLTHSDEYCTPLKSLPTNLFQRTSSRERVR
jgi:hypothetical protein